MELRLKFLVAVLISFFVNTAAAQSSALTSPRFKKQKIEITYKKIKKIVELEVAENITQQAYGLMNRTKLAPNAGMIFIFEDEQPRQFWMKNTLINLDIAYVDKEKTIIDIQTMKAVTSVLQTDLPSYPSKKPAQFAIEMNAGWFKKHKISLGAKIKILAGPTSNNIK